MWLLSAYCIIFFIFTAMMPMWLFTLGRTLFNSGKGEIKIPYFNLLVSLVMLTCPLLLGVAIRHFRPKWADVSKKIIRPFTIMIVVFGLSAMFYLYWHVFLMFTWNIVFAGAAVAICGYSLGAISAWAFKLERKQIVAISIETAYQNGGIAFILLLLSLPQPDATIAGVPAIAQLLLTGQPLWFVFLGVKLWGRYQKGNEEKKEEKVGDENKVQRLENDKVQRLENDKIQRLENACYDGPFALTANSANNNLSNGTVTSHL